MRLLIFSRDGAVAAALDHALRAAGHVPYVADDGNDAFELAQRYDFDAVLLDTDHVDVGAPDVLRRLRKARIATPILVLSRETAIAAKIEALDAGADDYLEKPFHAGEVLARVHAVARRARGHCASAIAIGALTLDLGRQAALVDGHALHLTGKEFALLQLLALRQGPRLHAARARCSRRDRAGRGGGGALRARPLNLRRAGSVRAYRPAIFRKASFMRTCQPRPLPL